MAGQPDWVRSVSSDAQSNMASVKTTVTMITALSGQVFNQYNNPTMDEITEVMDRLRTLSANLAADCESLLYSSDINPEKRFIDVPDTDLPSTASEHPEMTGPLQEDYRRYE